MLTGILIDNGTLYLEWKTVGGRRVEDKNVRRDEAVTLTHQFTEGKIIAKFQPLV